MQVLKIVLNVISVIKIFNPYYSKNLLTFLKTVRIHFLKIKNEICF